MHCIVHSRKYLLTPPHRREFVLPPLPLSGNSNPFFGEGGGGSIVIF